MLQINPRLKIKMGELYQFTSNDANLARCNDRKSIKRARASGEGAHHRPMMNSVQLAEPQLSGRKRQREGYDIEGREFRSAGAKLLGVLTSLPNVVSNT